jgi:hypothetical protein
LRRIHDKRCNKKIEVTKDKNHTKELNPLNGVYLLGYQLKNKVTSNLTCMCVTCNKIL